MTGPAADATRWLGHTHEEIYATVQAGAGPTAAHGAEQFWTSTAGTLSATAAQLGGAIQAAGAGWEGVAADATATGAAPLAAWALDRATLARRTSATLAVQAGYVDHVRREMPVPAPPGGPEVAQLGAAPDLLSDWSAADLARQNAAERAVEIMDQYTYNAYDTLPGVEIGSMPPAVVVDQGGATPAATPAVAPAPTAAAAALPVPPALAPAPVAAAAAPAAMAAPPATAPVAPAGTAAITGPPRITGPTTVPGRNPATAPGVDGAGSAAGGRAARSGAPLPGGASELPATVVRSTPVAAPSWMSGSVGPRVDPTVRAAASGIRPERALDAPASTPGGAPPVSVGGGVRAARGVGSDDRHRVAPPPAEVARGAAEPPVLTVSATGVAPPRTGRAEQAPYVPPPGGAGVRGTERTHRRPDYLITPDAFADDRVVAPAVIVPDDLEESRG